MSMKTYMGDFMKDERSKKLDEIAQETREKFNEGDLEFCGFKWFFREHISVVEDISIELAEKYDSDPLVVRASALLHDIGLLEGVENHNKRSAEKSREILRDYNFNENFIKKVYKAILNREKTPEGKILDSADALSHIKSAHFFAKAAVEENLEEFRSWAIKKINKDIERIHFEEEKKEAEKIANVLLERLEYTIQ